MDYVRPTTLSSWWPCGCQWLGVSPACRLRGACIGFGQAVLGGVVECGQGMRAVTLHRVTGHARTQERAAALPQVPTCWRGFCAHCNIFRDADVQCSPKPTGHLLLLLVTPLQDACPHERPSCRSTCCWPSHASPFALLKLDSIASANPELADPQSATPVGPLELPLAAAQAAMQRGAVLLRLSNPWCGLTSRMQGLGGALTRWQPVGRARTEGSAPSAPATFMTYLQAL